MRTGIYRRASNEKKPVQIWRFFAWLCHGFTAYLCRVPLTARITRRMIFQFKKPLYASLLFYAEDRKGNADYLSIELWKRGNWYLVLLLCCNTAAFFSSKWHETNWMKGFYKCLNFTRHQRKQFVIFSFFIILNWFIDRD